MSVNKVILVGNLGKDPELRYTPSGVAVATFSMATTERYKDREGQQQEKTEWHNVVVWRGLAEVCGKYLHKGKQVFIEGKIQTRKYQDRDGNDKYITEIVADNMQMLGRAGDDAGGGGGYGAQQGGGFDQRPPQQQAPQQGAGQQGNNKQGGFTPNNQWDEPTYNEEDDIPF